MNSSEKGKNVLEACLAVSKDLAGLVEYSRDSIVSKTILDKPAGTITLFAFDENQSLSEHTTPYDAVVQVLDGTASISIGGESRDVATGRIIIMPANRPHSVKAGQKFKMLLTMIRG